MRCQPRYEGPVYIWLKKTSKPVYSVQKSRTTPRQSAWPAKPSCPGWASTAKPAPLPLPATGLTCGQCLKQPPAFERVAAPWTYSFPVDSLITRFKHSAKWPFGRLLAELLGKFLQHRFDEDLDRPDALIPVPLASKRLRQRGFNQAAMLARWLSVSFDIPCDETLLLRIQDTSAQQELNADARKKRTCATLLPWRPRPRSRGATSHWSTTC